MTVKFVFNCQTVTLQLDYFTRTLYINKTKIKQPRGTISTIGA